MDAAARNRFLCRVRGRLLCRSSCRRVHVVGNPHRGRSNSGTDVSASRAYQPGIPDGVAATGAFQRGWGSPRWYGLASVPLLLWVGLGARSDMSVLVGLTMALTIVPVAQWERSGTMVIPRYVLFLGAASYSIYLIHVIAISTVARLVSSWPLVISGSVVAGVAAGIVYHLVIERPLLRGRFGTTARLLSSKILPRKRTGSS